MINPWFIFAYVLVIGACIGSFLNVVVYRMPLGKSLWHPPSTCPGCDQRIKPYDNIPVLGWIMLGGKCRNCKSRISIEYPLVEAFTALLLGSVFAAYYWGGWRPGFATDNIATTWAPLVVHLILAAALLAATLIDARHFIIPLAIPYFALVVAVIVLPLAEVFWPGSVLNDVFLLTPPCGPPEVWNIGVGPAVVSSSGAEGIGDLIVETAATASPMVSWFGITVGGIVGLILANILLYMGKLPRGFEDESDYCPSCTHHWGPDFEGKNCPSCGWDVPQFEEPAERGFAAKLNSGKGDGKDGKKNSKAPKSLRFSDEKTPSKQSAKPTPTAPNGGDEEEQILWVQHPHARREALKECLFLAFPIVGAVIGAFLLPSIMPTGTPGGYAFHPAIHVLAGIALGFLIGGGVVWATRILGTLGFGKEAMGLGDVHLLAAVGAIIGSGDAVVAFFIAPFFGLAFVAIGAVMSRLKNRSARVIPYGPYLAFASLLLMMFHKPIAQLMCDRFGLIIRF